MFSQENRLTIQYIKIKSCEDDLQAMPRDRYFKSSANPFKFSGLFYHTSLDQSVSNNRVSG